MASSARTVARNWSTSSGTKCSRRGGPAGVLDRGGEQRGVGLVDLPGQQLGARARPARCRWTARAPAAAGRPAARGGRPPRPARAGRRRAGCRPRAPRCPRRCPPRPGAGACRPRGSDADLHDVGARVGQLDRDDDVGAVGQRRAGHDPLHRARLERADVGAAGRDVVGHGHPRGQVRQLGAGGRRSRPSPSCRNRAARPAPAGPRPAPGRGPAPAAPARPASAAAGR